MSARLALAVLVVFGAAPLSAATLEFPLDEGAHLAARTEWWYVTGWLERAGAAPLGFQLTFFRTHPPATDLNPSAFAARQVLIAHAALADPALGRSLHAERIARAGFGLASVATGHTDIAIRDWRLAASDQGLSAVVRAADFSYALTLARVQAILLQGEAGVSRKGPAAASYSHYYSLPQLQVTGRVTLAGREQAVAGRAWLDHEWSDAYLDPESVGWDWVGLNLDDGAALMAFRMRDATGRPRWAGGTLRAASGAVRVFAPQDIEFTPLRRWRSPHTAIEWPVDWQLQAGDLALQLRPLLDDQESDSRLTTGAVYWEGAVTALVAGKRAGRGYLELTGYGEPLRLP